MGGNEKMEKRRDVKREFECHIFEENGDEGLIDYECGQSVLMGVGMCSQHEGGRFFLQQRS